MNNYSVLMSVYSKEKPQYLKESIESILNQTVLTDDFVIVCDGPLTQALDDVIKQYTEKYPDVIRVIRLKNNEGLGRALNRGMKECKNEVIARMDSDDISFPDRCRLELEAINQGYDIVSGSVLEFAEKIENIISERKLPEHCKDIYIYAKRRCPFNHPCVMYRKEAVLKAGGYQHFFCFEDYYLWVRMIKNAVKCYNLQNPVLYMRAGTDMYKRRGGYNYLLSMWRFRTYLLKTGFCGLHDWIITVFGQTLICIIPARLREFVYKIFLRS